jgi:hypothetical protein
MSTIRLSRLRSASPSLWAARTYADHLTWASNLGTRALSPRVSVHGSVVRLAGAPRAERHLKGCGNLSRGIGGALAVGLVPGHDVPGHEPRAQQAGLVAHAEEIRSRVVVVVGGDEPRAARGCGPPAGVFEQEQYESAGAGSVWVEPRRGVRVAPGVDLLDQIVQRRHVAIVDPPLLVRDDISEAVRLRLEVPRIGGHWYSMAKVAATREGAESANITGPSVICLASQRQ